MFKDIQQLFMYYIAHPKKEIIKSLFLIYFYGFSNKISTNKMICWKCDNLCNIEQFMIDFMNRQDSNKLKHDNLSIDYYNEIAIQLFFKSPPTSTIIF